VRIITDAIRLEDTSDGRGVRPHVDAGETFCSFVRSKLQNVPLLVFTSRDNITNTRFVQEVWLAGSTCEYDIAVEYVNELAGLSARGNNNSLYWAQYNAKYE